MPIIDPQYLEAIKRLEGFAPRAQWDYRQHTNGYGTRALYPGETIDRPTADQRFGGEIEKAASYVDQIAPNAPPGVRAALTSLTFNAGPSWVNAGLGEMVKAGDYQGAAQKLQEYNKAGGEVLPGLQNRRAEEASWFDAVPASQPTQTAQAPQMPAYAWTPGSNNPQPAAEQQASAAPTGSFMSQGQAPSLSFEQIGRMLGLEDPPPLQFAQHQPRPRPLSGPSLFRRT